MSTIDWAKTADGVAVIVAEIDAGTLEASPTKRAFLAGCEKALRELTETKPAAGKATVNGL